MKNYQKYELATGGMRVWQGSDWGELPETKKRSASRPGLVAEYPAKKTKKLLRVKNSEVVGWRLHRMANRPEG